MSPFLWWVLPALCATLVGCAGNGRSEPSAGVAQRPRSDDRVAERLRMVATQVESRGIDDPRVLAALRAVPRHWFVPVDQAPEAYGDHPLPIGRGQTISQPYIVALMTEALALAPAARVLEIGTGSGYQAAVLSELCAEVYTIEIVPELAANARAAFERHRYANVHARAGDGFAGWPEHAPFDAVIVTAAPDRIPEPLIEQLKIGGRLVIPVGENSFDQNLWSITKEAGGSLQHELLAPVRFVPMTGAIESD